MRRYYERFDRGSKPLISDHLLGQGYRDVEEAARMAADRADVQARLDHIKHYLRSVHLRWLVDGATDAAHKKELTLAALTHGYRTRYTYMNHWIGMRDDWATRAAIEFKEPTWAPADATSNKAWADDRPYTREEIETAFQEGLNYFQPNQDIHEKKFSSSLIPVKFPTTASSEQSRFESVQTYQWTLRYALYSGGEPLQFSLTAGTIPHYRDMAPASWSVVDAQRKQVASGRLPLDGTSRLLEVKVPVAGLYYLDVDDSMAGWQIRIAAGRSGGVLLDATRHVEHAGWMQPMYFYVPKGTRELQYYWLGQPHRVHGPDGALLKEAQETATIIKVKVPDGCDGKVWHFTQLMLGKLQFMNAPNLLAASPDALLIPEDLAEQDGLQRLHGAP